ncbi:hypothetical protein RB195_015605 [Necator americanus]|uniref:C6 domain-containing protein n=1 Tax=Necator americanus TaxID=51031 RepID=A0ABR1E5K1_NECAM
MRTLILLLCTSASLVGALPPKGCTSCMMVLIERHPYSGIVETQKMVDGTGCFVQKLKCRGNKSNAETFVQFNQGSNGFLAHGDQEVKLECSNDGHWLLVHNEEKGINVESVACLST